MDNGSGGPSGEDDGLNAKGNVRRRVITERRTNEEIISQMRRLNKNQDSSLDPSYNAMILFTKSISAQPNTAIHGVVYSIPKVMMNTLADVLVPSSAISIPQSLPTLSVDEH